MAFVSPRMNLKVWNAPSDPYDHEQLADNWLKVDRHDHSEGRGAQIGAAGIQNGAITTAHLAPGAIATGSVADASITTGKLAAGVDTSGAWRRHIAVGGTLPAGTAAGTYVLPMNFITPQVTGNINLFAFYIDPANLAVTNRNTVWRIHAWVMGNLTAPGPNVTFGFWPCTVSMAASGVPTAGTTGAAQVTTSTAINPTNLQVVTSNEFSIASNNLYVLATTLSAPIGATNPVLVFQAALQMRYV